MKNKVRGFTLIELLVVIAIIAILSTVVMAGLNTARSKGRDAKRLSDIKQAQAALELSFDACDGYVSSGSLIDIDTLTATGCTGLIDYMNPLPVNPLPNGTDYQYCSLGIAAANTASGATPGTCTAADLAAYQMTFTLENVNGGLPADLTIATPSGIRD